LYNTPEEKAAANREKSKRSYVKYCHSRYSTNHGPSESRHLGTRNRFTCAEVSDIGNNPRSANTITFSNQELSAAKPPTLQVRGNGLGYWSDRVERVAIKLKEAVGVNPGVYIEGVYQLYLTSLQKDNIRDAVLRISRFQTLIYRYQDAILQAGGPLCEEWKRSDVVRASVCDVVKSLEEILTYAMVDYDELILMYKSQKLMFQQ
ncbi:hypothetical protein Hypma_012495, partial [Hypsizygus marmoreus]